MKNIDKINAVKKEKVVTLYQQLFGHITDVCAAAGINRTTFYNWIEKDDDFARQIKEAEMELNDDLRDVLIKKAGEGSTAELIFYLKNRHPDFKPQPTTLIQNNNYRDVVKEINDES